MLPKQVRRKNQVGSDDESDDEWTQDFQASIKKLHADALQLQALKVSNRSSSASTSSVVPENPSKREPAPMQKATSYGLSRSTERDVPSANFQWPGVFRQRMLNAMTPVVQDMEAHVYLKAGLVSRAFHTWRCEFELQRVRTQIAAEKAEWEALREQEGLAWNQKQENHQRDVVRLLYQAIGKDRKSLVFWTFGAWKAHTFKERLFLQTSISMQRLLRRMDDVGAADLVRKTFSHWRAEARYEYALRRATNLNSQANKYLAWALGGMARQRVKFVLATAYHGWRACWHAAAAERVTRYAAAKHFFVAYVASMIRSCFTSWWSETQESARERELGEISFKLVRERDREHQEKFERRVKHVHLAAWQQVCRVRKWTAKHDFAIASAIFTSQKGEGRRSAKLILLLWWNKIKQKRRFLSSWAMTAAVKERYIVRCLFAWKECVFIQRSLREREEAEENRALQEQRDKLLRNHQAGLIISVMVGHHARDDRAILTCSLNTWKWEAVRGRKGNLVLLCKCFKNWVLAAFTARSNEELDDALREVERLRQESQSYLTKWQGEIQTKQDLMKELESSREYAQRMSSPDRRRSTFRALPELAELCDVVEPYVKTVRESRILVPSQVADVVSPHVKTKKKVLWQDDD